MNDTSPFLSIGKIKWWSVCLEPTMCHILDIRAHSRVRSRLIFFQTPTNPPPDHLSVNLGLQTIYHLISSFNNSWIASFCFFSIPEFLSSVKPWSLAPAGALSSSRLTSFSASARARALGFIARTSHSRPPTIPWSTSSIRSSSKGSMLSLISLTQAMIWVILGLNTVRVPFTCRTDAAFSK